MKLVKVISLLVTITAISFCETTPSNPFDYYVVEQHGKIQVKQDNKWFVLYPDNSSYNMNFSAIKGVVETGKEGSIIYETKNGENVITSIKAYRW